MQHAESTPQVRGVVKSFHQTVKGDVDGLVLEDGREVRFAPHFGEQITDVVSQGDEVTCQGRDHWQADLVTHLKSGRALEVKGPPPIKEHSELPADPHRPHHEKDKPHHDHIPHSEQMLAEIRAIRAALGVGDDEPTNPGRHHGPPHEQILHGLRSVRSLVERGGRLA